MPESGAVDGGKDGAREPIPTVPALRSGPTPSPTSAATANAGGGFPEWGIDLVSAAGVIVAALIAAQCVKRSPSGGCVQGPVSFILNRQSARPDAADGSKSAPDSWPW